MRVVFDEALDGGVFPADGVRDEQTPGMSSFGLSQMGPRDFLNFLEAQLGLSGRRIASEEQNLALVDRLLETPGYWSRSLEADPLATAARLLRDRDELRLLGWKGENLGNRLTSLWNVCEGLSLTHADRIANIESALARANLDLVSVELIGKREHLSPHWQRVFKILETRNVTVTQAPEIKTQQEDDLGRALHSEEFLGDGTIQLFRPYGPVAAAKQLAAALSQVSDASDTLVIGGDEVLDQALDHFGLAPAGLPSQNAASMSILPLVLEAAFAPCDPAHLHALLTAQPGPIPRFWARRFLQALGKMPGRGAAPFTQALDSLSECEEAPTRKRIAVLLQPSAARDETLPVEALEERLVFLNRWAQGNVEKLPSLKSLALHCTEFLRLARIRSKPLCRRELLDLCKRITPIPSSGPGFVGLSSLTEPGGLIGPSPRTIWWNFSRKSTQRPYRLRLSPDERSAMQKVGLPLPDTNRSLAQTSDAWRRPLHLTTKQLILVCPEVDEGGEKNPPHPLWDELSIQKGSHKLIASELKTPFAATASRAHLRPLVTSETETEIDRPLSLREFESPSSMQSLLSCSTQWTLRYHAKLRSGFAHGPNPPSPLLYGTLAHEVIAEVFGAKDHSPSDARVRTRRWLDENLDSHCEAIALPRYKASRAVLMEAIENSAADLARLQQESGAKVRGCEIELTAAFDNFSLRGRADLILEGPDVIVDLKWGKASYRDLLKAGAAFQLAAYAHATDGEALPSTAYFSLRDQSLMSEPNSPLKNARAPGNTSSAATWEAALASIGKRLGEIQTGHLQAPSADGRTLKPANTGQALILAPACSYCDFAALCGKEGAR